MWATDSPYNFHILAIGNCLVRQAYRPAHCLAQFYYNSFYLYPFTFNVKNVILSFIYIRFLNEYEEAFNRNIVKYRYSYMKMNIIETAKCDVVYLTNFFIVHGVPDKLFQICIPVHSVNPWSCLNSYGVKCLTWSHISSDPPDVLKQLVVKVCEHVRVFHALWVCMWKNGLHRWKNTNMVHYSLEALNNHQL